MTARGAIFAAFALSAAMLAHAASDYSRVDIEALKAEAKEYRHRADVLRKMIGVRERKIGQIQQQVGGLMTQAEADAQMRANKAASAQQTAMVTSTVLGAFAAFMPGGDSLSNTMLQSGMQGVSSGMTSAANAEVKQAAVQGAAEIGEAKGEGDNLMASAKDFEGEKKKLAYKARQYEQLADGKDLLAAGEILRERAQAAVRKLGKVDQTIEKERHFVRGMSLW